HPIRARRYRACPPLRCRIWSTPRWTSSEALSEAGITGSIGTVGDALDNAQMEQSLGLFKNEVIDHEQATSRSWRAVEKATASWVHWFNNERLHSSIGDIPPLEYEQNHYDSTHGHHEPAAA